MAIEKALSSLEKAEADLALEEGSQAIAREELQLLTGNILGISLPETDLLLRKPQLKAEPLPRFQAAKAELRQARLNLRSYNYSSTF